MPRETLRSLTPPEPLQFLSTISSTMYSSGSFSSQNQSTPWNSNEQPRYITSLLSVGPAAPTTRLEHETFDNSILSTSTSSVLGNSMGQSMGMGQSFGLNKSTASQRTNTQPIDSDAPPFASLYEVGASPDRAIRSTRFNSLSTPVEPIKLNLAPPVQETRQDSQPMDTSSLLAAATTICVFGFPPSFAPAILSHFRDHGDILHHELASDGNWMFITYASRFGAQKAVNKNGTVVYGVGWQGNANSGMKCMVGVRPATEQEHANVIQKLRATQPQNVPETPTGVPGGWQDAMVKPQAMDGLQAVGQRLSTSSGSVQKVFPPPPTVTTLQKDPSSGVLSKAADWLFGWT